MCNSGSMWDQCATQGRLHLGNMAGYVVIITQSIRWITFEIRIGMYSNPFSTFTFFASHCLVLLLWERFMTL
jgi:hypothetical protein